MRNGYAKNIALGGVLAALAVVIMSLGGLIPVATFICPVLCMILGTVILKHCGHRISWAWYAVVAILSMLLGPDKEAAVVYLLFGYYPIIQHAFDKLRFGFLCKLLYFNGVVIVLYLLILRLFGLQDVVSEYMALGVAGVVLILLLGNAAFFLLDRLLVRVLHRR